VQTVIFRSGKFSIGKFIIGKSPQARHRAGIGDVCWYFIAFEIILAFPARGGQARPRIGAGA
jgi:hypothetical protein